ncbi:MAG: toxin-antitoxin system HicB family antitoxin [Cellulomonas sp.]
MDLTRYVDDLQHRLLTAAEAAGDDARELAQRLTAPLDAAVRLVLLDALSTAAGEISAELAPGSVDLRLRGGDPEFVVAAPAVVAEPALTIAPSPSPRGLADSDADADTTSRTTLRLPEHLKARVEVAAARDGISVNAWLVRAIAAALDQPISRTTPQARPEARGGTRLTGWVR